jgi:phosphoglycerate dehydrogenase-like enzyme
VLVGLGHVGSEIARRAAAFDVTVTAVTRSGRSSPLAARTLSSSRLAEAVTAADHLVLAVPDSVETRGLVDDHVLDRLAPHACVVNVGRPRVLDTTALLRRLRIGALRAAMLDVHDVEPLPGDDERWDVPNLWVTPHGAYRFEREEQGVADVFAENLEDFRKGSPLRDRVNLDASR